MKVTQSCPTLCNSMDYTVHAILQARILEWVAAPFSEDSWNSPGQDTGVGSCSLLQDSWHSPGQDTGAGSQSLFQGIFPTQGLNPGSLLNQLSHQGSPKILEWVAYLFSSRSSWPRNQTGSLPLQVDSLPAEPSGNPNKSGRKRTNRWRGSKVTDSQL